MTPRMRGSVAGCRPARRSCMCRSFKRLRPSCSKDKRRPPCKASSGRCAQVASFRTITRSCRLGCSFRRRMPQELHCLTSMIRARCHLLQQDYTAVVEDCKQFGRLEEEILGTMRGEELKKAQEQVGLAEVAAFVQRLGCAAEIAVNCRTKVTQGLAFKMVVDHAERALKGLQPCPEHLLGLKPLRAHLHLSRAQACLELELWTKAKEDALAALRLDAGLREAEYFVRAADARSW
ncbi:unnamed protein product [Durusdinium trenchii]|uniref:Uncharacterized protein n=1 Tax=Durusdinium trenchii TaxID=1381693 RepID=A0ABP0SID2_9DINO